MPHCHFQTPAKMQDAKFIFGLIADVQYADIDNGQNFRQTRTRYYRQARNQLVKAQQKFNSLDMNCILQLGDMLDGKNSAFGTVEKCYNTILAEFRNCKAPVYHVWGNHEFYNFSRDDLVKSDLNSARILEHNDGEKANYYSFLPDEKYKFIILDCFEFSMLGYSTTSEQYMEAEKFLRKVNHNEDLNDPVGLPKNMTHIVKYNGATSEKQLFWLEEELKTAENMSQNVVIAGNFIILL